MSGPADKSRSAGEPPEPTGSPPPTGGEPADGAGLPKGDAGPAEPSGNGPAGADDRSVNVGAAGAAASARRARAERAIEGTLSVALVLEALTVLFVPRAIAPLGEERLTAGRLAFLLGLAGALVVAAGLQRRRAGRVLGTALQAPLVATGLLVSVMFVLGLLFTGVWVYLLRTRRDLLAVVSPDTAARSSPRSGPGR